MIRLERTKWMDSYLVPLESIKELSWHHLQRHSLLIICEDELPLISESFAKMAFVYSEMFYVYLVYVVEIDDFAKEILGAIHEFFICSEQYLCLEPLLFFQFYPLSYPLDLLREVIFQEPLQLL